jgi:hypothetical protein
MTKLITITPDVVARFWAKVNKTEEGCWLWTAGHDGSGYGSLKISGKQIKAHRISYTLANGAIPDGLWVLHKCDTPRCVRPDHLFIGTSKDNVQDMIKKRRMWVWTNPEKLKTCRWPKEQPKLRGMRHPKVKLTFEQVCAIRERFAAGGITKSDLAREYGVRDGYVGCLIRGEYRKYE